MDLKSPVCASDLKSKERAGRMDRGSCPGLAPGRGVPAGLGSLGPK